MEDVDCLLMQTLLKRPDFSSIKRDERGVEKCCLWENQQIGLDTVWNESA